MQQTVQEVLSDEPFETAGPETGRVFECQAAGGGCAETDVYSALGGEGRGGDIPNVRRVCDEDDTINRSRVEPCHDSLYPRAGSKAVARFGRLSGMHGCGDDLCGFICSPKGAAGNAIRFAAKAFQRLRNQFRLRAPPGRKRAITVRARALFTDVVRLCVADDDQFDGKVLCAV